jgi:hypothetical protein
LAGNVFLVDYEDWGDKPMQQRAKFRISPAFSDTISANFQAVLNAVGGDMPKTSLRDPLPGQIRAAAGLLLARASAARSRGALDRLSSLTADQRSLIQAAAMKAVDTLALPSNLIESNWTVDPYGIRRLANRMTEKIQNGEIEELLPIHPGTRGASSRYAGIFNRAMRELHGVTSTNYGGLIATYAVPWMQGKPYPVLLSKWINYNRRKNPNAKINDIIRRGFEFFEQVIRFQMVQVGKAYLDVLHYVLSLNNLEARRAEAFDFALALELGVSSTTGRSFIELGLSRIAAAALQGLIPDSELTPTLAKQKLGELDWSAINLSQVIVSELKRLELIAV